MQSKAWVIEIWLAPFLYESILWSGFPAVSIIYWCQTIIFFKSSNETSLASFAITYLYTLFVSVLSGGTSKILPKSFSEITPRMEATVFTDRKNIFVCLNKHSCCRPQPVFIQINSRSFMNTAIKAPVAFSAADLCFSSDGMWKSCDTVATIDLVTFFRDLANTWRVKERLFNNSVMFIKNWRYPNKIMLRNIYYIACINWFT